MRTLKTQQDFERLVTCAFTTGSAVLTFAWDLRLGLQYDVQKKWLFIATPMNMDEPQRPVGDTCKLGQPWALKAQVALTLAEGCIQGLREDGEEIFGEETFSGGSFQKLKEVPDAMRHKDCELQFFAKWRLPSAVATPKQGRNDKCACGSGRKFKKCCGGN